MRTAVFALTERGAALAGRIQRLLPSVPDVYVPEGKDWSGFEDRHFFPFKGFGKTFGECFAHYDVLVCIMATGIVVRTMAPLLKDKLTDPAVIVCDERGQFAISLLSGHVGGANDFARQLAKELGAQPVIATATDVEGRIAPDSFAGQLALLPWPKERIKAINKALLYGEEAVYLLSPNLPHRKFYAKALARWKLPYRWAPEEAAYKVYLTTREELPEEAPPDCLYLMPPKLIAGIGCRRNVPKGLVLRSLSQACQEIGRDISFIDVLASVSIKADEEGLLAAGEELQIPLNFYETEELQACSDRFNLSQSEFVRKQIGTGNVCEAAAICEALKLGGRRRFALAKTKYEQVTVALLWCW